MIQRVSNAAVTVDNDLVASIGHGLLVLLGVTHSDTAKDAELMATKLANLRIFADDQGKMNRSVIDVGGEVLLVSQFTLYGDIRGGRRPAFVEAAAPFHAEPLVEEVASQLRHQGLAVASGIFGAMMEVSLVNDGPVTLSIEIEDGRVV